MTKPPLLSVSVSGGLFTTIFQRSDFIIRQFVDGVETFGFREDFGWGSYTEEDGSGTFGIGPIVRENESVTYTIEILNPRMQLE